MSDRPILFSGPMVRALLAGTKTQTRRVLKPQPTNVDSIGRWYRMPSGGLSLNCYDVPHKLGDRLWVRETWAPLSHLTHNDPGTQALVDNGFYRADQGCVDGEISPWKPSIFMPRTASRLTLAVTDVRVQRLKDISEEDARAEGVDRRSKKVRQMWLFGADKVERERIYLQACKWEFEDLWDGINGKPRTNGADISWTANPWVVATTFTVHKFNIDRMRAVV